MHTSPANRRGIWQTMKVIEEIIEYMGEKPRQIYIEFAREDDPKAKNKRTDSRKRAVDKALNKLKEEVIDEYNENVYKELKQYEKRLDEEKVYLYFMQNGKDLYFPDRELNLDELEKLEIDHIIPYSLSDDDSLDNKALVLKGNNQNKGNKIVKEAFPQLFSNSGTVNYWKNLKKAGLISEKKYNNLQKNNVDDILTKGFINRQLVETRQIVKSVANLILDYYNEQIDVIEVKANLKELDTRKYGGYKGGEKAYFVLVKYCIEKALKKSVKKEYHMEFVEIPVYIARGIKNNDINLYDYVCDILNEANKNSVADVEILRNKVPKYQMIIGENGEEYYLVSATEVINSKQFVLGGANQQYNRLLNYIKYGKNDKWQYIQTELLDEQLIGLMYSK